MTVVLPAQNGSHTIPGSGRLVLEEEAIKVASELGKSLKLERLVEAYEDDLKVPEEFVNNDPEKASKRCWGDDDECKPTFKFPLIDLAPLMRFFADKPQPGGEDAAKKIIADIGKACENWGFFKVVNHGIPVELLDQVMKVSKEFFQLPIEEKEKCAVRPGEFQGYGRIEFKVLGQNRSRSWNDALRHEVRPVPNQDRMPLKPEAYRPVIEEYTQGLERMLLCLWKALSVYLGLAPDTLRKAQQCDDEESNIIIRINCYPKCNEPEKVLGLHGHRDFGSLTILLQDEVGGFQVQKPGTTGPWFDVPPNTGSDKGTLLVNIANQVEAMSNGRLPSALHRALVSKTSKRISVVAFVCPGSKCVIGPLPEVLEKTGQLPRYSSFVFGDYTKNLLEDVKAGLPAHARYEINRN